MIMVPVLSFCVLSGQILLSQIPVVSIESDINSLPEFLSSVLPKSKYGKFINWTLPANCALSRGVALAIPKCCLLNKSP